MTRNEFRSTLSIVSLLLLIIGVVCYFSKEMTLAYVFIAVALVGKIAELVIRFTRNKN